MKVSVLRPEELSGTELSRWGAIQRANPSLASPFFSSRYTLAVSSVRRDVRTAILEEAGRVVGFFPFQRGRWGAGRPVGGPLCDYQGLVSERDFACDAGELLARAGLRSWRFDHLEAGQKVFWPHRRMTAPSRSINLASGFDAYATSRRREGTSQIRKVASLGRKLARERGPILFEARDERPAALRRLLEWKSAQYLRSGLIDAFRYRWMVNLLETLLETREGDFAGILSTLSAGDRMIAAQMGVRSTDVWHYWVTAYDIEFQRYSPGLILLTEMARTAPSIGIRRIDLGKGDELYKRRLANETIEVAEGRVGESPNGWTDRFIDRLEKTIRGAPARDFLGWSRRFLDRRRTRSAYR